MDEIMKKAGGLLKSFKDGLQGLTAADLSAVIADVETCNIYGRNWPTEKECEQTILKHLRSQSGYNNVHQQFSVGGNLALKIDIDIDERIGIEIKMAEQLIESAANAQRLLGQVLYYSKRKYQQNVIVLIIGPAKSKNDPLLKELATLIEDDLGLTFLYKALK